MVLQAAAAQRSAVQPVRAPCYRGDELAFQHCNNTVSLLERSIRCLPHDSLLASYTPVACKSRCAVSTSDCGTGAVD